MTVPRWQLFLILVAAMVTAIAIAATVSQLTGYSAFTGDELESHRGERVRRALEMQRRASEYREDCLDPPLPPKCDDLRAVLRSAQSRED